ncbi:hypothetical protein B9Z55_022520 [Caenorhabditis nigoni]|uniref:Uncharacterized protein n=1 Tax=Caenorhabditis nigoni TaxID=1611254 RepID=A0A2G5SL01_9PELO|nr:hypothetical protein B9Z55_022520 [Caenorhabditis nigoni]
MDYIKSSMNPRSRPAAEPSPASPFRCPIPPFGPRRAIIFYRLDQQRSIGRFCDGFKTKTPLWNLQLQSKRPLELPEAQTASPEHLFSTQDKTIL